MRQHTCRNMLQDLESSAPAVSEVLLPAEDVASVLTLLELAYGKSVIYAHHTRFLHYCLRYVLPCGYN